MPLSNGLPIDPGMVATTDGLAGYRIVRTFGVAEGFSVALFGGFLAAGERQMLKATLREAILEMLAAAAQQGANAVVGLRYQPLGEDQNAMMVYGTAVKVEKVPYGA